MTFPQQTAPSKSGARRANALPSACMLDEYRIDTILGAGGFGVTYQALDTHLDTWVAIKEYFPVEWSFRDADGVTVYPNTQGEAKDGDGSQSDYLWGLERFLEEARVLARIQHPCVVRIKRYFRAHGTAYIVMDYEEGRPLNALLRDGETLDENTVCSLLEDVLPALAAVHRQGYLHRDIKPANLYVRACDHRVILIDFGAARQAMGQHSKSVTSMFSPGYSPIEQYLVDGKNYGPWTDIYALGAVLYRCITGHAPPQAADRLLGDTLEPAITVGAGRYSTPLLDVIDRALAVRPEQRFVMIADMQAALMGSQNGNGDRTVIMPLAKPGEWAQASEESRVTQSPVALPPGSTAARWRLPIILVGGLALMATAAVIIGLGSSQPAPTLEPVPEQKPPPRYSLGHGESPLSLTPATPSMGSPSPAVTVPNTTPPVTSEPAVAPPTPITRALTNSPNPAETPIIPVTDPITAGASPKTADVESAPPLPAAGMTGSPPLAPDTPALATTPSVDTPVRATPPVASQKTQTTRAPPKRTRTVRQRSPRQTREQPVVITPTQPVQAQPAPALKHNQLWDAPSDMGFNQK